MHTLEHAPLLDTMMLQRMDNVGIVVDDLEAATAFFLELAEELSCDP